MGDRLRVGLALESVTPLQEEGAKLGVVLHDTVVNDDDAAVAAQMRVGVLVARLAVRRPARVTDASRAVERVGGGQRRLQVRDLALALGDDQRLVLAVGREDADARRVVTAVLEVVEGSKKDGRRRLLARVANDSAHGKWLLSTSFREGEVGARAHTAA